MTMETLENSGRSGRADAVYSIPICLEKNALREQSSILSNFVLNNSGACAVIFDTSKTPHFRPHQSFCGLSVSWRDDQIEVHHIISRNPDGKFTVYDHELWSKLVESMDIELKEHLDSIDLLCSTLGVNTHVSLEDKLCHIAQELIDSSELSNRKLQESITELRNLQKACNIINSISIKENTYQMTNSLVSSVKSIITTENDSSPRMSDP